VWVIGIIYVAYLLAAVWVQLFIKAGNEWQYSALWAVVLLAHVNQLPLRWLASLTNVSNTSTASIHYPDCYLYSFKVII